MATPVAAPIEDEEEDSFANRVEKQLMAMLADLRGTPAVTAVREMPAVDAVRNHPWAKAADAMLGEEAPEGMGPVGQVMRNHPAVTAVREMPAVDAVRNHPWAKAADVLLGEDPTMKDTTRVMDAPAASKAPAEKTESYFPQGLMKDVGSDLMEGAARGVGNELLQRGAGALAGKAASLGVAPAATAAGASDAGASAGDDAQAVAPAVSSDQLLADFRITHGGPFDPKSRMDAAKLDQLKEARAKYPAATSTQLALKIYRGEFD